MENFFLLLVVAVGSLIIVAAAGTLFIFMILNLTQNLKALWRMYKHTNQPNWWEREMNHE